MSRQCCMITRFNMTLFLCWMF